MPIFPLVELHLGGRGFDGAGEFAAQIEGAAADADERFAQGGEVLLGIGNRFASGPFYAVAEDAAGAEQRREGVEIGAQLLAAEVGNFAGEVVALGEVRTVQWSGDGLCGHGSSSYWTA